MCSLPSDLQAPALDEFLADCEAERADASPMRRTLPPAQHDALAQRLRDSGSALKATPSLDRSVVDFRRLLAERRASEVHDQEVRDQVRAEMGAALDGLRASATARSVVDAAAAAARHACGFTRVLISAVWGSRWVPLVVHTRQDIDPAPETLQAFLDRRSEIPLANLLAETEMVRRRAAVHVQDQTLERRTFKPIVEAAGSSGYVGAPIIVGTEAIGIIHGDRVGQRHPATEDDRRAIGDFATSVSLVFERKWSAEVLASRVSTLEADLSDARAKLRAALIPEQTLLRPTTVREPGEPPTGSSGSDRLLTRREREVIDLVARGATNGMIADRLSLSEETVKSHMRTILRKLRVGNRNAAVARFRRLYGS